MNPSAPAWRASGPGGDDTKVWLIALAGYALMYLPVFWWAAQGIWQTEEQGHGPLVLAVILWLFWRQRHALAAAPYRSVPLIGWPVFGLGLLLFAAGRAFDIAVLSFASQLFVVAGALLLIKGWAAVRLAWFGIAYLIFLVPLPGVLVDAVTGPLKQWISTLVQHALFAVGYPIANTGVMLSIGQFQLLVADACSGLNSMFSLSALGTLFMYVMRRKGLLHNAIMLASILPIAFAANVVRVLLLVLLTYHFGDEAGQGFLHGAAGIALMSVALGIFVALDALLVKLLPQNAQRSPAAAR